jgi:hypothetical protein
LVPLDESDIEFGELSNLFLKVNLALLKIYLIIDSGPGYISRTMDLKEINPELKVILGVGGTKENAFTFEERNFIFVFKIKLIQSQFKIIILSS